MIRSWQESIHCRSEKVQRDFIELKRLKLFNTKVISALMLVANVAANTKRQKLKATIENFSTSDVHTQNSENSAW
jgi:hypothetical protein